MLNVDEARKIIEFKMRRFLSWSVYAISEDDENYYFFYGADDECCPEASMPVFGVSKADGSINQLSITDMANFKKLFAARVFYNRKLNINYNVEERAAIRHKYKFPDDVVLCPRCGHKLQWIKQNTSIYVQCQRMYCIFCSIREW